MEVTVTDVTQITPIGVLVILKLEVADVALIEVVKKAGSDEPSSFLHETSIVTPAAGMVEVTVTVNGKVVCAEGGCKELAAGSSVTASAGSLVPPPPLFFFLQLPATPDNKITIANTLNKILLIFSPVYIDC